MRPSHIVIIIVVLIILFGASKLPDIARSIGQSAKVLKKEIRELSDDDGSTPVAQPQSQAPQPQVPVQQPPAEQPQAPMPQHGTSAQAPMPQYPQQSQQPQTGQQPDNGTPESPAPSQN